MRIVSFNMIENEAVLFRAIPVRGIDLERRRGLRILLVDEDGVTGVGEASPLPGYSDETVDDCREALLSWQRRAIPVEVLHAETNVEAVRELFERVPFPDRFPSARFALETALFDLLARRGGVPLHLALNPLSTRDTVPLNALLDIRFDSNLLLQRVQAELLRGIHTFKVKVSRAMTVFAERDKLEHLRRMTGPEIELRLDANGGLSIEEVMARVPGYLDLGVSYIEEPCPSEYWDRVRAAGLRVAVDESMKRSTVRQRFFAERPADVVVVKPALLGGIIAALDIAQRARDVGVGVVVTHLFDGPVALESCRALAFALQEPPLPCGLDSHDGLSAWLDSPPIETMINGCVSCPSAPGIGFNAAAIFGAAL